MATGGAEPTTRDEIERWFLARGLPLVLRRTDRAHRLLERAAPTVVAVASLGVLTFVGLLLPDTTDADYEDAAVDGWLIALYAVYVGAVIVVPPCAAWATHAVISRCSRPVGLLVAVATIVVLVLVIPFLQEDVVPGASSLGERSDGGGYWADALLNVVLVLVVVWLTYLGVGSILTWAVRSALRQVAAAASLAARALPLVVLVVLIFFTGELWQLSARISRERLWNTVGFLLSICVVFLLVTLRDELAAILDGREATARPLTRAETGNVLLVMFLAQFLQIVVVATMIFAFFLSLGLVALPPEVIETWSGVPARQGTWLGVEVPVSGALIHMSLLVAGFSAMYFTVSSSTDPQYRERFFDPLIADMTTTLDARDRYLARWHPSA